MRIRSLVASLGLTALAAAAACKSSSPYSSPANVAVGTGIAVAAAAANRAVTHECWGACRPGTVCDHATGLCVEPGHRSGVANHNAAAGSGGQSIQLTSEPYPAGHEYEVPPVSAAGMADAGCAPRGGADAGAAALFCEEDAGATSSY